MGDMDFGFSLSEESTDEMQGMLEEYAQNILNIFHGFQERVVEFVSGADYEKLVKAIDRIIDLYGESVQQGLKTTILERWRDDCETMEAYAEEMEAGEESAAAARSIEETLEEIFSLSIENRLSEIRGKYRGSASVSDFEEIISMFDDTVKEVRETSDLLLAEAERCGEENSLYRFLVPVIVAYHGGVCKFFDDAREKLDELKDAYIDKMAEERDRVKDAPKIDFGDMLDFSDLVYDGIGEKTSSAGKGSSSGRSAEKPVAMLADSTEKSPKEEKKSGPAARDTLGDACTEFFCQKLYDALLKLFHSYCRETDSNSRDFIQTVAKAAEADGLKIKEYMSAVYSQYQAIRSAFWNGDFFQSMNRADKENITVDRSREQEANALSRDLLLCFEAVPDISFDDCHRYALLIKKYGKYDIVESERDHDFKSVQTKGLDNIYHDAVKRQQKLNENYRSRLFELLTLEPVKEHIVPIYSFEVRENNIFYQRAAQEIEHCLGVKSIDTVGLLDEETLTPPAVDRQISKPVRPATPPWIDAATKSHFEPFVSKPKKLRPNVCYFYEVAAESESKGKCWYGKVGGSFPYTTYYCYETDGLGRIVHAFTESLVLGKKVREGGQQNLASLHSMDDGGHIFRTNFGGSPYIDNILSQHTAINMKKSNEFNRVKAQYEFDHHIGKKKERDVTNRGGQWYGLEETWKTALSGQIVAIDIRIIYQGDDMRPHEYRTITKFADPADGTIQTIKTMSILNPAVDSTLISLKKSNVCSTCGSILRTHTEYKKNRIGEVTMAIPIFYCPVCKKEVKAKRELTI